MSSLQLAIGVVVGILVLSQASAAEELIPASVRADLLSLDFSAEVSELPPASLGDTGFKPKHLQTPWDNLSLVEQRLLAGHRSKAGQAEFGVARAAVQFVSFYRKFGKAPQDGIDLLLVLNPDLVTRAGADRLLGLSSQQQFELLRVVVNPATGRVYESFRRDSSSPFHVAIWRAEGENATRTLPFAIFGAGGKLLPSMREHQRWEIEVYGSRPGVPIAHKEILTLIGDY